jgi:hypothetical protein
LLNTYFVSGFWPSYALAAPRPTPTHHSFVATLLMTYCENPQKIPVLRQNNFESAIYSLLQLLFQQNAIGETVKSKCFLGIAKT